MESSAHLASYCNNSCVRWTDNVSRVSVKCLGRLKWLALQKKVLLHISSFYFRSSVSATLRWISYYYYQYLLLSSSYCELDTLVCFNFELVLKQNMSLTNGMILWMGDQSMSRPYHHKPTETNIHASSGIPNSDPVDLIPSDHPRTN